jgi:hypothetical protein
MDRKLLVAAALLLLCSATTQARILETEAQQGRELLQAKTPNCTKVDAHCSLCRNQRIPGERRSELVCQQCEAGYRLRRDGISKTCGKYPFRVVLLSAPSALHELQPAGAAKQQQQQQQ